MAWLGSRPVSGGGGMRVLVAAGGRFHVYDLAHQMERLGHLARLYAGYPKWKVRGVSRAKMRTFPWVIVPAWLLHRLGIAWVPKSIDRAAKLTFDRWVARNLEPCDVFHGLSQWATSAHRVARERYGALTVCDRGSSHIVYQDEILAEEFRRWGLPYPRIDPLMVERELQEYEECDMIMVPSGFVLRSFLEKGVPREKLVKVSYGVDLGMFRRVPKEDNIFRVIYVGGMGIRKGLPYLIEALAPLKLLDLGVWLIGGLMPEAQSFMRSLGPGFQYLGIKPRAELYRYYSQGSVFVIPSIEEGLALVQAQAMACGLPVIATTNTGAEDLFTDGAEGFIVPIRDPAAIREKVLFLYENREATREMGEAALKRVQGLGGWNAYGESAEAAYRTGLSRLKL